ncbi:MAG: S16 family serine protease, partial [Candidatus Methanoperedens sp.]|nr:S16 family serine protease [Candidatus Methanoperedens sp.]
VLINIEAPVQEQKVSISGGSAGAAMTLAAMAAMQDKTIRNDVFITGTIREDHTIGRIGAPRAKALAAKESGAVMFLVPAGQKSEVGDAGIEVREVATIEEAASYALA